MEECKRCKEIRRMLRYAAQPMNIRIDDLVEHLEYLHDLKEAKEQR